MKAKMKRVSLSLIVLSLTACQSGLPNLSINPSNPQVSLNSEIRPGSKGDIAPLTPANTAIRPGSKGELVPTEPTGITPVSNNVMIPVQTETPAIRPGSKGDRLNPDVPTNLEAATALSGLFEIPKDALEIWLPELVGFAVQSESKAKGLKAFLEGKEIPLQIVKQSQFSDLVQIQFILPSVPAGDNQILEIISEDSGFSLKTWIPKLEKGKTQHLKEAMRLHSTAKVLLLQKKMNKGLLKRSELSEALWDGLNTSADILEIEAVLKAVLKDKKNKGKKLETLAEVSDILETKAQNANSNANANSNLNQLTAIQFNAKGRQDP